MQDKKRWQEKKQSGNKFKRVKERKYNIIVKHIIWVSSFAYYYITKFFPTQPPRLVYIYDVLLL